jgi:hypothetical protein
VGYRTDAWRRVVVLLASGHEEIPAALGYPRPAPEVRAWARQVLDRIDDFYDADDVDDVIAARLERELKTLADPSLTDALARIATLFALPNERGLRDWHRILWGLRLRHAAAPNVPLAEPLRDRLSAIIQASNERRVRVRTRTPGEIDDWEWAFQMKHETVEAETLAFDVLELRATDSILQALTRTLSPGDRQALEDWANAELRSCEPGPRPSKWPAYRRLQLPQPTAT